MSALLPLLCPFPVILEKKCLSNGCLNKNAMSNYLSLFPRSTSSFLKSIHRSPENIVFNKLCLFIYARCYDNVINKYLINYDSLVFRYRRHIGEISERRKKEDSILIIQYFAIFSHFIVILIF